MGNGKPNSGTYTTPWIGGTTIKWERGWRCPKCPVSWSDGAGDIGNTCPWCGSKGELDDVPEHATITEMPEHI